jgi:hypothetical protein
MCYGRVLILKRRKEATACGCERPCNSSELPCALRSKTAFEVSAIVVKLPPLAISVFQHNLKQSSMHALHPRVVLLAHFMKEAAPRLSLLQHDEGLRALSSCG